MNKLPLILVVSAMVIPILFSGVANGLTFLSVGDPRDNSKICSAITSSPGEVLLALGDYYGKIKTYIDCFKKSGKVVIVDVGNHDKCSDIKKYNSCTVSYVKNGVAFQSIDTNQKSIDSQKKTITANFDKWQNDSSIYAIVLHFHKSPFGVAGQHHSVKEVEKEIKGLRAFVLLLANTYSKFGVVFAGHDHGYILCSIPNVHLIAIQEGSANIKDPYPWGSKGGDGCKFGLSGSKYNGYSISTLEPKDGGFKFTTQHISIGGGKNGTVFAVN